MPGRETDTEPHGTAELSSYSRLLFASEMVLFGRFDIRPDDPRFSGAGEIRSGHHVVFPGTAVGIVQEGREPFVADPNLIVLYNRGQPYRRIEVSGEGDHCYWLSFRDDVVAEAMSGVDTFEDLDRPFPRSHVPGSDWSYLIHRVLGRHLDDSELPRRPRDSRDAASGRTGEQARLDFLEIEEVLVGILEELASRLSERERPRDDPAAARDLTERVKGILNLNLAVPLTLDEIAGELDLSPYHLCRTFRSTTGITIHRYRIRLRLRRALERLLRSPGSLTDLALELGFSSHSHFTATFRRRFGVTPSRYRDRASAALLEELTGRLPD